MKWRLRLARDMAQEAIVVIEAPNSEEAEAIFWHEMDPDVICWSNAADCIEGRIGSFDPVSPDSRWRLQETRNRSRQSRARCE